MNAFDDNSRAADMPGEIDTAKLLGEVIDLVEQVVEIRLTSAEVARRRALVEHLTDEFMVHEAQAVEDAQDSRTDHVATSRDRVVDAVEMAEEVVGSRSETVTAVPVGAANGRRMATGHTQESPKAAVSTEHVEPTPASATNSASRSGVFYHNADLVVTDHSVRHRRDTYAIEELTEFRTVRGPAHPAILISAAVAVVQIPIVIPVVAMVRSPLAFLLAAVLLVVPCAVAIVSARRWPPRLELQARYRGRDLVLFTSYDEREFGKVIRALRRAVERHGSRPGPGLQGRTSG